MRFVIGVFLFVLGLSAQTHSTKGRQVVDAAVSALGGSQFLQLRNRVETGRVYSFYREELRGLSVATIYYEYLDGNPKGLGIREREVLGKKGDYSYLYLENEGFELTFRGARPIADENWKRYQTSTATNIFNILRTRLNDPAISYDFVRYDVILNTQVNIVDISDGPDRTIRVYFEENSKLPIRQEYSEWDPVLKLKNTEVTDFSKYRNVGSNIQLPFVLHRERNGEKIFEVFADKVEINQTLPPKIFDLPAGVKILHKLN